MPKTKISEFDVDPANNTDINSINIAEGCAPSGINNAIRQLMSDLKEFQTGGGGDPFNGAVNGTVGATTPSTGAFTTLSATGVATVSAGSVSAPAITTSGDTNTGIFFPAADTIAFTEGGTEAMRITSAGNVGIGTASPTNYGAGYPNLTINGTTTGVLDIQANGTNQLELSTGTNYAQISAVGASGVLAFTTAGNTERMRINSSGNVGIGTSSPSRKLSVYDTSNIPVRIETNTADTKIEILTTSGTQFIQGSANNLLFGTNNTERMRLDSSGNLLVGTTSSQLGLVSAAGISGEYSFSSAPASNAGSYFHILFRAAGNQAGYIYSPTTSTTAYITTSDYRLKENVAPMTGALNKVALLKPCTYKWKTDGLDGQGFIAHELQEVVPDCVSGTKDAVDAEGKPQYQGIDTSFLVATLTAAIQELKAIVDAQATRIEVLENK
jgi:hypothetical protein